MKLAPNPHYVPNANLYVFSVFGNHTGQWKVETFQESYAYPTNEIMRECVLRVVTTDAENIDHKLEPTLREAVVAKIKNDLKPVVDQFVSLYAPWMAENKSKIGVMDCAFNNVTPGRTIIVSNLGHQKDNRYLTVQNVLNHLAFCLDKVIKTRGGR